MGNANSRAESEFACQRRKVSCDGDPRNGVTQPPGPFLLWNVSACRPFDSVTTPQALSESNRLYNTASLRLLACCKTANRSTARKRFVDRFRRGHWPAAKCRLSHLQ